MNDVEPYGKSWKESIDMKTTMIVVAALAATVAQAEFKMDRSVMSDAYWKVWNDDVQAKIDADIEKYRKADATVEVEAPDGAEVKVEQLTHGFFFGAHIFNFDQLGTKERNDRYKALYGGENGLFNSATVAFYWRAFERFPGKPRFEAAPEDSEEFWNACPNPKEQPHWRRPPTDPVIDYLTSRGCRIHGHPLVWGNNTWMTPNWLWDELCPGAEKAALEKASGVKIPRWDASVPAGARALKIDRAWEVAWEQVYKKLSDEEIARLVPTFLKSQNECYERRVRQIGERYGAKVHSWDVVNESATDFAKRFGCKAVRNRPFDESHYGPMPADYAYKAFMWSGKYLPKTAWFNLNDYYMDEGFFQQANDLVANGARIDVVGAQMHLFNPAESVGISRGKFSKDAYSKTHPDAIVARFEKLSKANRPIHLSEITITAPNNSPRGQMVQAIIMRNCYRAWFSVEKMNGITWWNVVDDCCAPGEPSISGLFTRDMRPKVAYFAMDDLVNREWKTRLTVAASGGKVSFRGFRGRYRLSWKGKGGKWQTKFAELK
jgi:GH35 family endo-1,4-beta-xylanase